MSAGRFVWRELVVASPAASFYASLFGWSTKSVPMGDMTYTLFRHATLDEDVGGSVAPQIDRKSTRLNSSHSSVSRMPSSA